MSSKANQDEPRTDAFDKLMLEVALKWGDYQNERLTTQVDNGENRPRPSVRFAKNIRFDNQHYLREFVEEVASHLPAQRTKDEDRLDTLQALAESGVTTFTFEIDGGVSGCQQEVGGDTYHVRAKSTVREVLDALMIGEGVQSPYQSTTRAVLEPQDMDILSRMHHQHANALQALTQTFPVAPERVAYWTEQFNHFRNLYRRLHGQLGAGPETVKELQQALSAEAEPPSAVVSEEDGHICDMAMLHGAKLVNESGTRYEFTEAQLLAFTKANRQPG